MKRATLIGFMLFFFFLFPRDGAAQFLDETFQVKHDTNYIRVYKDELTTRLFLSRKQNGYHLSERFLNPWITYRTNDNLLLGIGYTYSFLTLNLAFKLPFLNVDDDLYGESKYIDLQSHAIFKSYIVDFYLQFNRGYYVSNPEDVYSNMQMAPVKPQRGDMRTNVVGLNVQYLFNSDKFSYKASFVQNEFQRKSAGSPIVGMEGYWVLGMTDSAMVDPAIPSVGYLDDQPFNQADILNVGFNGGYAYTFVWKEKLYLSLSTIIGLSLGKNWIHYSPNSDTFSSGFTMGVTNSTRISLGYNSNTYYVGLSWLSFTMTNRVGTDGNWLGYNTGNIRFNIVKRFITKRPIKILRPDLWTF